MENTPNIQEAYIKFLLLNGKEPISVLQFCESIEISEDDFFASYNSFKSVEKAAWKSFITDTIEVLHSDPDYPEFSAREKALAFYYTLMEVLKQNRSLVLFRLSNIIPQKKAPFYLTDFFNEYTEFMKGLVREGFESQELVDRPFISDYYKHLYKVHLGYILKVWVGDSSKDYQLTDAAIEKSVNLLFDLLEKGPFDSLLDFGKFVYQNKAF